MCKVSLNKLVKQVYTGKFMIYTQKTFVYYQLILLYLHYKNVQKARRIIIYTTPLANMIYIFIPFGRFSSFAYNPGRPIMICSAMRFPDWLCSFAGLRICEVASVCCNGMFRTPSATGLTSCPSFSFSVTSGVGGASSNCILRSSAAS